MNLTAIKTKAKNLGIKVGKMSKVELIHAIQTQENNSPCFSTGNQHCDQLNCLWRKDCLEP